MFLHKMIMFPIEDTQANKLGGDPVWLVLFGFSHSCTLSHCLFSHNCHREGFHGGGKEENEKSEEEGRVRWSCGEEDDDRDDGEEWSKMIEGAKIESWRGEAGRAWRRGSSGDNHDGGNHSKYVFLICGGFSHINFKWGIWEGFGGFLSFWSKQVRWHFIMFPSFRNDKVMPTVVSDQDNVHDGLRRTCIMQILALQSLSLSGPMSSLTSGLKFKHHHHHHHRHRHHHHHRWHLRHQV